jgi:enediyne biosynthesis protein E4
MSVPLSPRRRRLHRTLALLTLLVIAGTSIALLIHRGSRPKQYRPDESASDITSELAKSLPPEAPKPKFLNVTPTVGLAGFRNFNGARTSQLPEDMGPGVAWGDYDNDGDEDLFLVSAGGALNVADARLAPCELYENIGGTFHRVTALPELRIRGMGAAWGDYDGDGLLDLVISGYNTLLLVHNDGGGKFSCDSRLPNVRGFWSSATWGDYDNDRRLDLYVCGYVHYNSSESDRDRGSTQIRSFVPFTLNPSSFTPGTNLLFHQNADGTFTEQSAKMNVQNIAGRSLGAIWHDFDQDGWLDLYVANDVSDNVFYRNAGGTNFINISHPALVADYRSAMGLAIGDYDRDGDDDIHVTHWAAQENALYDNTWADFNVRGRGQRVASPASANSPTHNHTNYPLRFLDIADQRGLGQIALSFVGWGTEFADLDHDGWLDLLVVNGSTIEQQGPYPKKLKPQEMFLFWNQRGHFFHNIAPLDRELSERHVSRGLACADFDADGDLDFMVSDLGESVRLFRNDMATGHWLKIRLRSKNSKGIANGFGDGSMAVAWVNGVGLRRGVSGVSYLSQSSHTLHWGLGSATRVEKLEIRWHAGGTNFFENLDCETFYEIREGDPVPTRLQQQKLTTPPPRPSDKERLLAFWSKQRAAMDAMKRERDNVKAIALFREAIALNPAHEDSRYYLGLCLASQGDSAGALAALEGLQQINPQSHRAWQQWGIVRALHANSDSDLACAERALERAHSLNPEETGALLVLGEVSLMRGDVPLADQRLAAATHTNPKAAGGFFLRGYLAWRRGDTASAKTFLTQARGALGPDWQPKGATSEGEVKQKQHVELTPLTPFWSGWDGREEPAAAFAALERRLSQQRASHYDPARP